MHTPPVSKLIRRTAARAGHRLRPPSTTGTASPLPPFRLRVNELGECNGAALREGGRAGGLERNRTVQAARSVCAGRDASLYK